MVWQAIGHCSSTLFNEVCTSKTLRYDDTIDLGNKIYPWITKVAAGPGKPLAPQERIFEYRYEDFTKRVSKSNACTGDERHCSVPVPPFWCVTGQSGTRPHHAGDQKKKNEEDGSQTTALPETKNLEDWHRSSPISTKSQLTYFGATD